MDTKITIYQNSAFHATLRAIWWLAKIFFKLVLRVGSGVVAIFVLLFDNDDEPEATKERESASSIHSRRGIGLSNSDRTKLDNSIHSADDY